LIEDLESWKDAEIIAREVAPDRVPRILFRNAEQLEKEAKHLKALEHYNNVKAKLLLTLFHLFERLF